MGLGKTVTTLSALDGLYLSGAQHMPTLILAPLRVAKNTWPNELKKWEHLCSTDIAPIVGTSKQRNGMLYSELKKGNCSLYTLNYENLPWLLKTLSDTKTPWPFGTIVADESTRLKNFRLRQGGQRARSLALVAHKHVERFIELTGTPAPNGLLDLWGQMWFLDQGQRLGKSFTAFTDRWFKRSYDGFNLSPFSYSQQQIMDQVTDLCLSIETKDHFNLEEPIVTNVKVELPKHAVDVYNNMKRHLFAEIAMGEIEASNAASKSMKLLQICNGAAYLDDEGTWGEIHSSKLDALESIVEEANGMPVLVAYHFKSDLARLQRRFPQGRFFDDSAKTERDWNDGQIPIMFIHPASGGHGLNLQDGSNIIVFFSQWWDLEQYQQVLERIGPARQMQSGHNRSVFVYHIIAENTIDEIVMERKESKASVQDALLEYMKQEG